MGSGGLELKSSIRKTVIFGSTLNPQSRDPDPWIFGGLLFVDPPPLNPEPSTLNPEPSTLNPQPSTLVSHLVYPACLWGTQGPQGTQGTQGTRATQGTRDTQGTQILWVLRYCGYSVMGLGPYGGL